MHPGLFSLVAVLALGIGAQWLAWRFRLPAILLLLLFGVLAGPVFGIVDAEALSGDALFPAVSLAVAVILFEGGLSLRIGDLRESGVVVWRLVTAGAIVAWLGTALAASAIVGLPAELSILLGAVLIVTGPTVIVPLLRQLHLRPSLASILKWEGILIDPLGAILAVLVFEGILSESGHTAAAGTIFSLLLSLATGAAMGLLGAGFLIAVVGRHRVPDFLHNPVVLAVVGCVLAAGNALRAESGLLAVTVMGIALAAQRRIPIRGIVEFKESLRTLFISTLFIVLAARMNLAQLTDLALPSVLFLLALIVVVRPLSVLVATLGTPLAWRERAALMAMAPRGIVAAAIASVLALRLTDAGFPGADALVPVSFSVIGGTILAYSISGPIVMRLLGVSGGAPQGVLLLGAHPWARALARALGDAGVHVRLADSNYASVRAARMDGLSAHYCNFLDERIAERLDLEGVGKLLALTSNDQANALAALHFGRYFDRSEIYQLAAGAAPLALGSAELPLHLRGRTLFDAGMTFDALSRRFAAGAAMKKTPISEEFDWNAYRELYGTGAIPMFLLDQHGRLNVFAVDHPPDPAPGQSIIALVDDEPNA